MAEREQIEDWKNDPWSKLPTWAKWVIGAVGVLVVIGIAVGDESEDDPEPTAQSKPARVDASVPPQRARTEPKPAKEVPASPQQPAAAALGDTLTADLAIGESEVRSVHRAGQLMTVVLSTPEGGFEGPSTDDADALASEALAKVYEDAGWKGVTSVEFHGGLASRATGREVPNADAFAYRMGRGVASQIDWSDEEALYLIDWSLYRTYCHPAFKGC